MDPEIRKEVAELLRRRDFERLMRRCREDGHFWREIQFRLYDLDEIIRWRAIETAGRVMGSLWKSGQKEKVRKFIRTLFWSMNDESGGIGWSAPQTIAEVVMQIPEIAEPYVSMMIAHSIEEPPLVKGCLWGMGRLGFLAADAVPLFREGFLAVFGSDDIELLGLASWAAGETEFEESLPRLNGLLSSLSPVRIYHSGDFVEKPLREWAAQAISRIAGDRRV